MPVSVPAASADLPEDQGAGPCRKRRHPLPFRTGFSCLHDAFEAPARTVDRRVPLEVQLVHDTLQELMVRNCLPARNFVAGKAGAV
jgi:hypothetical protein